MQRCAELHPEIAMTKPITEKQKVVLEKRGFSPDELSAMSCGEACEIIRTVAKYEKWTFDKSENTPEPARREYSAPKKSKQDYSHTCVKLAGYKCLRCGTTRNPRAFKIAGESAKAVLCTACYQLVAQAAFMEYAVPPNLVHPIA